MGWLGGLLAAGFLLTVTAAYGATGWTLYLDDQQLTFPKGALSERECEELYYELEGQAPQLSNWECVEINLGDEI